MLQNHLSDVVKSGLRESYATSELLPVSRPLNMLLRCSQTGEAECVRSPFCCRMRVVLRPNLCICERNTSEACDVRVIDTCVESYGSVK
jgi:hypothetical protein